VIVVSVLLLLATATMGWRQARPVEEFGAGQALGADHGEATDGQPTSGSADRVSVADGRLARRAPSPPARIESPAIDLIAPVIAVGVDQETHEVEVPAGAETVGWYRFGADLGTSSGSIAIAGHVDREGAKGPFFRLRDSPPGAEVKVIGDDGATRSFTVVAREVFAKTDLPVDRIFARNGPPRLSLITCGGAFDPSARRYLDNIVVTAIPA
jgi:hypothetical protein